MKRLVINADALQWLPDNARRAPISTSWPDAAEINMPVGKYAHWFENAVRLSLTATNAVAVFLQTDRRADCGIISKAGAIFRIAETEGFRIHWHRIVLRHDVGKIDRYRPAYSHLIAVGRVRGKKFDAPDVIPVSKNLHDNGMPIEAADLALRYVKLFSDSVVDPFVGWGTTLAVAEKLGFREAIGVDIDPSCVDRAKRLAC